MTINQGGRELLEKEAGSHSRRRQEAIIGAGREIQEEEAGSY